jgi:hypothetical protein
VAVDPDVAAVDLGADPPPGCAVLTDGPDTVLTASTRSLGNALGAFAVGLFWNGIVSVFILTAAASTLRHTVGSVPEWFPAPTDGKNDDFMPLGMTIFLWIFLLPFIAIGTLMVGAMLMSLFGRVEVYLRASDGVIFTGCGPFGWRRRFDLAAVRAVSVGKTKWKENDETKPLIVIACDRDVRFGSMLPDVRRAWLIAVLKKVLTPE